MDIRKVIYREAKIEDMAAILNLYFEVYNGSYPDPMFTSYPELEKAIRAKNKYVFVACLQNKIIACLLFKYEETNLLAKAAAAVVDVRFRGFNLTQKMITHGIKFLQQNTPGLELIYVTTRTVHKAAQLLTQNMGFKKMGVLPNVHKTKDYETHALAGILLPSAAEKRFRDFKHHPKVYEVYKIVEKECDLPPMEMATDWERKIYQGKVPVLEIINAREFVKYRFLNYTKDQCIDFAFYPFVVPNVLITSPDNKIELFLDINEVDQSCVVIGCKIDREVSLTDLFLEVCNMLRDKGVRYVEMIARAHRLNIIDKMIKAKFIPCAYLPGLQLAGDKRYDYVIFSRSFEILDFNNIELTGINELYLKEYIKTWEETALGNHLKAKVESIESYMH